MSERASDLTARYESSMRAKARIAKAIGIGLYRHEWPQHVAAAAGTTYIPELTKAAVPPGTTFDPTWIGPATDERLFSAALLELVRVQTVVDRLVGVKRAPMNVGIPIQTEDPVFDWVGETEPIPAGQLEFDAESLPPGKISGVCTFSRELARIIDAQGIIERRMVTAVARGTDEAFLDPTRAAVPNVSPASITNGATAIPSSGANAAAVEADVAELFTALSGGEPMRPYVVMGPTVALSLATLRTSSGTRVFPGVSLTGGDLLGVPILISRGAANYLVALDADGIAVADVGMTVDSAQNLALQMNDAPGAGAQSLVSTWQTNLIALKATRWISWARRDDAVAYIDFPFGSPA